MLLQTITTSSIFRKYDEISAIKSLETMFKKTQHILHCDTEADRTRDLNLIFEVIPLICEANRWLREYAAQNGLRIEEDYEDWMEAATETELLEMERIIFMLDAGFTLYFFDHVIERLFKSLAEAGDTKTIHTLLDHLSVQDMYVSRRTLLGVAKCSEAAAHYAAFASYLKSTCSGSPKFESSIINAFITAHDFRHGTNILKIWTIELAKTIPLNRHKTGNRWSLVA
jgi:hypothetical protein